MSWRESLRLVQHLSQIVICMRLPLFRIQRTRYQHVKVKNREVSNVQIFHEQPLRVLIHVYVCICVCLDKVKHVFVCLNAWHSVLEGNTNTHLYLSLRMCMGVCMWHQNNRTCLKSVIKVLWSQLKCRIAIANWFLNCYRNCRCCYCSFCFVLIFLLQLSSLSPMFVFPSTTAWNHTPKKGYVCECRIAPFS